MTIAAFTRENVSQTFPKSARLLKSRDFRFRPYQRFQTQSFSFLYTGRGSGRLGISIAKKVLRSAAARNRVRRLLREFFRLNLGRLSHWDVHVIGSANLTGTWRSLELRDVEAEFNRFLEQLS